MIQNFDVKGLSPASVLSQATKHFHAEYEKNDIFFIKEKEIISIVKKHRYLYSIYLYLVFSVQFHTLK